jgi:SWI/SNF-related matrix-associated actin-dependent regulator of chromatin subfamily B protein 1
MSDTPLGQQQQHASPASEHPPRKAADSTSHHSASPSSPTNSARPDEQHPSSAVSSRPSTPKSKGKDKEDESAARTTTARLHYEQYTQRDLLHAAALAKQTESGTELIRDARRDLDYYTRLRLDRQRNPGAVFGYGYAGFGNGISDGPGPRVLYPCQRKRPGGRKARELRLTRTQLAEQAERLEMLVPIRLDIDFDKIKLRDTFTWNLHDNTVPLDLFVEQLVEDFHLPLNPHLQSQITHHIKEQLTDFHPHVFLADEPLDPVLPYTAYKNDDMRVLIKLNITIGQHTLVDQFEWDINNPMNSPEEFAQLLTREMSLSGEFTTAIAHSIREQCQLFTKALYVTNHPFDGRPIEDEDVRTAMLQSPITSVFRPYILAKEFSPLLYELSENELDRAEKSQSREQRRLKRVRTVNRRGGPTIPDLKDMPKTHRTQIVSSILPGAVQKVTDLEKSMVVKQVRDGESDEEDSESEAEDLPPEKTIPGFNNMTRRQRMAALNAQKANTQQLQQQQHQLQQRSQTPEKLMRHETPIALQQTPLQQTITLSPPKPALPRRPGVPLHQESALVKLKINAAKWKAWIAERGRQRQIEAERERQEQKQQQQQVVASMPPPLPQTSQKSPAATAAA